MTRRATLTMVSMLTLLWASFALAAPQEKSRPKQQTAMTGCIDEQDGHYVLISAQDRSLVATLEADGFPTEGFAKHLGHKVTVRGTAASEDPHPIFKVRSIETVSESCGPQQQ